MRLFERPRKVTPEPTYQFHFELTQSEVIRIQQEMSFNNLPRTCAAVLRMMTRDI